MNMMLVLRMLYVGSLCVAAASAEASEGFSDGFSDRVVSDIHPETEVHDVEYKQFVYNPHIIINPPKFSVSGVTKACCNCSTIQVIVAAETARLETAYRRLRDETREQLQELQAAMTDIAESLRILPVSLPPNLEKQTPSTEQSTTGPPPTTTTTTTTGITETKTTPSPMTTKAQTTPHEATTTPSAMTTKAQTTTPPEAKTTPSLNTVQPPTTTSSEAKTTTTTPATTTTATPQSTTKPATRTPALTTEFKNMTIYKDCSNALARGVTKSGVYKLQPEDNGVEMEVYCDMDTDGGGWTVFQRRQDGSVDFFRDFASYRRGFGDLEGEFWMGNDNLHRLTSQDEYVLRVDLSDFQGNSVHAVYNSFGVADLSDNYRLSLGQYSGTAGDSMTRHSRKQFTAKDVDNDDFLTGNCARLYHGAWWYERCHQSNLNGNYLGGDTNQYAQGVVWRRWKGYNYSLKTSQMKFRKKN